MFHDNVNRLFFSMSYTWNMFDGHNEDSINLLLTPWDLFVFSLTNVDVR